ncbi:PAS domain-containing sensor histidine kinase [Clostridium sp. CM027]|uniref:sensor histidine kinase n=1 Tax=Clostridium sp. CM027 TaxID=2849865 RepID=UPI001C6F2852|nr:PAS domain-containing sensor histidine kinase [Clostridium sp. CM027]MBW9145497.1 PAS domain-containing sensor histidine kinase [Clostridium sp. CM027]UVE42334.1 PAS domain-containing sensor histidine kinase [Clostridium sp. CM027]
MSEYVNDNVLQETDIDKVIELSKVLLFENDRNALHSKLINIINSYFKVKRVLILECVNRNFEVVIEWKEQCGEAIFYNERNIKDTSNIFRGTSNIFRGIIEEVCDCKKEKVINKGSEGFEVFYPLIYKEELLEIIYIEKNLEYSNMDLKMLKLICFQVAAVMERISIEEAKVQKIESEEEYKKLFELSPDAICVLSGGKIVLANPATEGLFDVKDSKDIIGRSIMEFVHLDYIDIARSRINIIYEGGMTTPFIEEKFLTSGGSVIDVELGTAAFKYKGELAVLIVTRNIDKRKKMERNLRESETLLREITENTSDMIIKTDTDGRIKYITAAQKAILGYATDNVIERHVFDFVYGDDKKNVLREIRKLITSTTNEKFKCRCLHANGDIVWLEICGSKLLDDNNKVKALILSSRDITKRLENEGIMKENEEKTRFLNQAIKYDRFRTDFFANISHELRTPINVISGTIQLMELKFKELFNGNEGKSKEYLKTMKQNCYRLIRLTDNLIDVTKIDAGYFEIHLSNCNIVSIIEEITLSVAEYVSNKGISLLFDTEMEEKIIACDKDKIERIMLNLISNAIKFTNSGGNILVYIFEKKDSVVISVKDTGIGIEKEKQQCIFERFIQVDKSLTRNREGSGIGLSLVKSLVEMHGGKMFLESEINIGSKFSFELPIKKLLDIEGVFVDNNLSVSSNIEKIKIEFSDIY